MSEKLETRSEKRLHKRLARAAQERKHRLEAGQLSLESGSGKLAIIVSGKKNPKSIYASKGRDTWFFRLEAERLARERAGDHQEVVIRTGAIAGEMTADFANPEITDIILIGHGTISSIPTDSKGYFTWWDAAKAATNLKQGKIEQRMCGNFPPDIPYHVPLGTFAVSDLANVVAAPGKVIPDCNPADELFHSVYAGSSDAVGQIQALNEGHRDNTVIVGDNRQLASI